MAYCTLAVALAAAPALAIARDKEVWECTANTTAPEPVNLLLRFRNGSKVAQVFATKANGARLIISGDLSLEDDPGNFPVVTGHMLCDAHEDQFVNEVVLIGRLSKESKVTETQKSASRSLAVNRYIGRDEHTDWFRLRGYGYSKDKLINAPKGSLVSAHGCLEQRKNRDGNPYLEVKCRNVRVHNKAKGGLSNPAAGTSAAGYDQEDFEQPSNNDMPFNWND